MFILCNLLPVDAFAMRGFLYSKGLRLLRFNRMITWEPLCSDEITQQ